MIKKILMVMLILGVVFVSGCTSPLQEVETPLNSQQPTEMPPAPPTITTGMVVGGYT